MNLAVWVAQVLLTAAIGLVLPAVIGLAAALAGLGAFGLALLMIGAALINQRLGGRDTFSRVDETQDGRHHLVQ